MASQTLAGFGALRDEVHITAIIKEKRKREGENARGKWELFSCVAITLGKTFPLDLTGPQYNQIQEGEVYQVVGELEMKHVSQKSASGKEYINEFLAVKVLSVSPVKIAAGSAPKA